MEEQNTLELTRKTTPRLYVGANLGQVVPTNPSKEEDNQPVVSLPDKPFVIQSATGSYTIYPRIDITMRNAVLEKTGLWLPFPPGVDEISYIAGKGYFGGVYLAQSTLTKRFLGVKIIRGEREIIASMQEGEMQRQLNGMKHLMPLIDSFESVLQGERVLCHVMPLAGLGNIKAIGEELQRQNASLELRLAIAYHIARGLFSGLQQMHACHLYHLDIKPPNIVIDGKGTVSIIDFGCTQKSLDEFFSIDCPGDIDYCSPERRQRRLGIQKPFSGAAADSWGAGVALLQFLVGTLEGNVLENPSNYLSNLLFTEQLPPGWIKLLGGLLDMNESQRLTMAQALDQLAPLEPDNLSQSLQRLPELVQHYLQEGKNTLPHPITQTRKAYANKYPSTLQPEYNAKLRIGECLQKMTSIEREYQRKVAQINYNRMRAGMVCLSIFLSAGIGIGIGRWLGGPIPAFIFSLPSCCLFGTGSLSAVQYASYRKKRPFANERDQKLQALVPQWQEEKNQLAEGNEYEQQVYQHIILLEKQYPELEKLQSLTEVDESTPLLSTNSN